MTDKSFELTYSDQGSGFEKGRRYANPRFFSSVRAGVNAVTVIGDYPKIVEAYEAKGIPVTVIAEPQNPVVEVRDVSVASFPDDLGLVDGDTFSDEQLRAIISEVTGKAPHHMLGRAKLIEQFNAACQAAAV
ncbi:hypothetical protein M8997_004005 [Phyllobacterium sp. 21LDTY02-6]|uniref:hypothetical protein n=1 Tax=Phyllobacterium sp. 21LDTY02-6 TaxID=2944903 RepID=UPI00201FD025|nr:hypothetical protein [Phyllobacterium sp. 21LDTY02-6]MCO4316336.1 hypothetical protein [Phyllobacterium sp. 21LDTY02-6]